ncbi:hypothetical protein BGW39_008313 [Mortierella sp. 14UC]|nr:hypothetical protein BGW39_008313 [Mortierella sp. 14UC]
MDDLTTRDELDRKRKASKPLANNDTHTKKSKTTTEQDGGTSKLDIILADHPGESIQVTYKLIEPIANMLDRIRVLLGINTEDLRIQNLFVNGRRIEDHQRTIDHYRIFGHIFTYRHQTAKRTNYCIYVKTLTGRAIIISCRPEFTIHLVKGLIEDLEGIPPPQQQLHFARRLLEDRRILKE